MEERKLSFGSYGERSDVFHKVIFFSQNKFLLKELDYNFNVIVINESENFQTIELDSKIIIIDDDFLKSNTLMLLSKISQQTNAKILLLLHESNNHLLHYDFIDDFLVKPIAIREVLLRINFMITKKKSNTNILSAIFPYLRKIMNSLSLKIYQEDIIHMLQDDFDYFSSLNNVIEIVYGIYNPQKLENILQKYYQNRNWNFLILSAQDGKLIALLMVLLIYDCPLVILKDSKCMIYLQDIDFLLYKNSKSKVFYQILKHYPNILLEECKYENSNIIYKHVFSYKLSSKIKF